MSASETRDRLLDAAWALALERGVADLTLGEVGARAGVSRQAVYLHFGNRTSLLVEMARRHDRSSGFLRRITSARQLPPLEAFRRLLDEWYAYLPKILPVARALEAAAVVGSEGAEAYHDRMSDWRQALCLAIERLHADGRLDPTWDVERAGDWTWTLVHPTAYHHLAVERGWAPDDVRRTVVATVEAALLSVRR